MTQQVLNTCKSAYIQLRQISSIRHFLTPQAPKSLACALVLSRLDYCNCLLAGCPLNLIDRMQKVQNAAARLIFKAKKSDHIKPILQSLHWLPIRARIQYKICTTCFNTITGSRPQYLSELLHPYTPSRELRSSADTQVYFQSVDLRFSHLVAKTNCLNSMRTMASFFLRNVMRPL